jgi:hypothetical protein
MAIKEGRVQKACVCVTSDEAPTDRGGPYDYDAVSLRRR